MILSVDIPESMALGQAAPLEVVKAAVVGMKGDLDGDGDIDCYDLLDFSRQWLGASQSLDYSLSADFDEDQRVDLNDLLGLCRNWRRMRR